MPPSTFPSNIDLLEHSPSASMLRVVLGKPMWCLLSVCRTLSVFIFALTDPIYASVQPLAFTEIYCLVIIGIYRQAY